MLDKVQTPDSTPTTGSTNLVTSGGVKAALDQKVDKVSGKGLSTNDYTDAEKQKLGGIASGAQVNVIEGVQVNGTDLPVSGKKANVAVPTKTSDINNDSGFITKDADNLTNYKDNDALNELLEQKASKSDLEDGTLVPKLAGDLESWASRGNLSVKETFSDIARTSGGDVSINSAAGCIIDSIVATKDFYAASLINTGKNLLRRATAVGTGWYFLAPALEWGAYGSAAKPNGVLVLNSNRVSLGTADGVVVYFKPLASGVPTSATDGTAIAPVVSEGKSFYCTSEMGYIIISGIDRASTCVRIAWSTDYDEYIAIDAANDAGGELALAAAIHAMHDYDVMLCVGGIGDSIERLSDTQVNLIPRNNRIKPTWTTTADEVEEGATQTYTHKATIAGLLPGGSVRCGELGVSVNGTEISYQDTSEDATTDWVYYNLATITATAYNLATGIAVNDWGLTILTQASGEAKVTMRYAQGYPDAMAALLNGGVVARLVPLETGVAENRDHIRALETYAFGQDLSFIDPLTGVAKVSRSTANSYIIRKPGVYRIPLIYGNGIKNGAVNSDAYTRQGSTYTADFVNHLGAAITAPYIEDNAGCVAVSAGLLWQTASGMISNVGIYEGVDCKYLAFTVASVPATNGLAVLHVKDANGDIMWSWTVWCAATLASPFVLMNFTNAEYEMFGEPMGAIWNANRDHFTMPHYQWGRKDPMAPAAAYNSTTQMTLYDIEGNVYSGFGSYGVVDDSDAGGTVRSVANAIKMPNKFFLEYDAAKYNWNNLAWFNNFWDASITASGLNADNQATAIKTIYDPCPVGWMLPGNRFATGFTTTGGNSADPEQFNIIGSFASGYTFKKNAADEGGVYFPAAGYRYRTSGGLYGVGSYGYFWSLAPFSQAYARSLYFSSGSVYPLLSISRASGFSVWACRELN